MNIRIPCLSLFCLVVLPEVAISHGAEEPARIPVARPVAREVADYEVFTGRAEAPRRVDLRARVTGYLDKVSFREGQEVRKGDVLFEVDPRPYRAEVDKVDAAVNLAEARLKIADANLRRARARVAQKAIGEEELDKATAERTQAEALAHLARAGRESARLNLDFCRVVAPLDGRIGRALLDVGNLVKADDTLLATVVTREPLHVYFDIDERTLLHLLKATRNADQAAKLSVELGLSDEEGFPHRAVVDFVSNVLNPDTGTIRVRAVLPNKDGLHYPGLSVRVRLLLGPPYKALLVPAESVQAEDGARFVLIVNDKDEIEKRPVKVGRELEGRRIVTQGLQAADRVVVGRFQQLRPGTTVRPVEGDQPPPKPAPRREGKRPADARPLRSPATPSIVVETVYAGANAQVVADTVAAPIEQQVNGGENQLGLRSRCTSDGKYTLAVALQRGADLPISQVLVQNRVAIALPVQPDAVKKTGATVTKATAGVLMIATLSSPGGRRWALPGG